MTPSIRLLALIIILLITANSSCKQPKSDKKSVENTEKLKDYNLENPEKFFMPTSLFEISGITLNKAKSDTIYMIQDEEGKFFRMAWNVKKQSNSKFGKSGDYEDLAIMNDKVLILKSNGTLYSFPLHDANYPEIDSAKEWKQLLPKGEYEAIYANESSNQLYIICKNCPDDKSKKFITGYIFTYTDSIRQQSTFQIDVTKIMEIGEGNPGFRPSALAKNPITNEWFIVSAVNKLLVVTDENWKIKHAVSLTSNMFTQPEGITFDKEGNMYISNEGDDFSEGNILKFKRLSK